MTPKEILKKYYGYPDFRPGQRELIGNIMAGRDVVGILPTGGGKSVCYQIPAIAMKGLALVISPLISLMKDQVDSLEKNGVRARFLNSSSSSEEYFDTVNLARRGQLDLLYVAPERLESDSFINTLSGFEISMVAVDEAHCVSQWGHDFRPSYMRIREIIDKLPVRPVLAAFTATATLRVRDDIQHFLGLDRPLVYVSSFDRANIRFSVMKPSDTKAKYSALLRLIDPEESTIIYCSTRKNVEAVDSFLRKNGLNSTYYHAGLRQEIRTRHQEDFIYDNRQIIVATNAFGMGIDKPDVRKVIHFNMPKDLESYYQEAGRAGRDGAPAEAVLLFTPQDIMTNLLFIEKSEAPNARENLTTMISYCNTGSCLRRFILLYFGENPDWDKCHNCSCCSGEMTVFDCTVEAQKIVSCIYRMGQRFGAGKICDVLTGSREDFIFQRGFDKLSTYGIMSDYSANDIKEIISLLSAEGYLRVVGDTYMIIQLTPASRALLKGEVRILMNKPPKSEPSIRKSRKMPKTDRKYDPDLFRELRSMRLQLAREETVPPFHIFTDKTLIEMASKFPQDKEEMMNISGVGESKMENYGSDFLDVINGYIEENNINVNAARKRYLE